MSLQYSFRVHIEYFKENISCERIKRALIIASNHWGVQIEAGPIAEVVASPVWLARFLIEENWSRVKVALERV